MIKGEISPFSTAVIPLRIKAYDGRTFEVEATVDTGFSGYLTLPSEDIVLLGLPFEQDWYEDVARLQVQDDCRRWRRGRD